MKKETYPKSFSHVGKQHMPIIEYYPKENLLKWFMEKNHLALSSKTIHTAANSPILLAHT